MALKAVPGKKAVFNLEFPDNCHSFSIGGYNFERAQGYESALQQLHHRIDITGEFEIKKCDGGHAVTGYATPPENQEPAILDWGTCDSKAISDILLLLSLFTGRDVFAQDISKITQFMNIPYDQRQYLWGGALVSSLTYESSSSNHLTSYDVGFERQLNKIYALIKSELWQTNFKGGNYLKLAHAAMQSRKLETAFLSCWTIWEHLFAILNENWLASEQIEKLSAGEKISFLLVKYAFKKSLDKAAKNRISSLASIRNRLIHFGFFPEKDEVMKDALLFVHMTEYLIAQTLELKPSQVFNTMDRFEKFLVTNDSTDKKIQSKALASNALKKNVAVKK